MKLNCCYGWWLKSKIIFPGFTLNRGCQYKSFFTNHSCLLQTYYDVLKVPKNATAKEIKDAYIKLTKESHPDLNPADKSRHERFVKLQEAYQVLGNANARREYDIKISPSGGRPFAPGGGGGPFASSGGPESPFTARSPFRSSPSGPSQPHNQADVEWIIRMAKKKEWQRKYGGHSEEKYGFSHYQYKTGPNTSFSAEDLNNLRKSRMAFSGKVTRWMWTIFIISMILQLALSSSAALYNQATLEEREKMLRDSMERDSMKRDRTNSHFMLREEMENIRRREYMNRFRSPPLDSSPPRDA